MFKLVIGIITTFSIIAGGIWGWLGFGLIAGGATAALLLWTLHKHSHVFVPEMEVAVVYTKGGKAFSRFLVPGSHWLAPFKESIGATISTAGQSTRATSKGVRAIGGLPLQIDWAVTYSLDPLRLSAAARPKMARVLPAKADKIVQQHVDNVLHHVVGNYSIESLTQPGAHRKLERQVRQLATARLEKLGIGVAQVMIGAIQMPKHVRQALEAAHEREMQAENEARALERLQKVVSQFSEADMARLMELERIHVLGKNGVAMLYPALAEQRSPAESGRVGQAYAPITTALS